MTRSIENKPPVCRRAFLRAMAGSTLALATGAVHASRTATSRALSLYNTHTGEQIQATFWESGEYARDALHAFDVVLRDHRCNEVHAIDPTLLDLLHDLQRSVGTRGAFHVISGYRSPQTNAMLRRASTGVASHSLHMDGRAIDIRLPGCALRDLQSAAIALRRGGVGYYARSDFVHVDTGRVRRW